MMKMRFRYSLVLANPILNHISTWTAFYFIIPVLCYIYLLNTGTCMVIFILLNTGTCNSLLYAFAESCILNVLLAVCKNLYLFHIFSG